jgi:nucleoid-associated protein EbfC
MNMQNLMAQAQKMQRDIENKKKELDSMDFIGKSEWVEITFDGSKNLKNVKILKELPILEDDKEILEDMISIAINDAYTKINNEVNNKLGKYASLNGFM